MGVSQAIVSSKPLTFSPTHLTIQNMRKWQIKTDDPGSYILAADARWGGTDYTNDHIWELKLKGGEPPALSMQTTFGLRARNYRIFPRFIEGDSAITDPELFSTPLTINRFDPNFLVVSFSPFAGIDVTIEYWAVTSQVLAGRLKVANSRLAERLIRTEISAILTPTNDGERMAAKVLESVAILCGKTDALYPVIYMTGGPEISAGPFPALSVEMSLTSGATRQITWVQTAGHSVDESYALARKTATKKWDSEIAKITVSAQRLIDIQTGDTGNQLRHLG